MGKELPDSKGILVFVLLADMLNTIIREIISLGASDLKAAGIATVVMFALVIVLFFGILVALNVVYLFCTYDEDELYMNLVLLIIETIGAVLYFFGDNSTFIFDKYGEVLGCDQQCVETIRITAIITLGIALIFYHLFPPCIRKIAKLIKFKSTTTVWYSASDMITTILKVDALFTVVAIMAQTTGFCSRADQSISISFLVVSLVVGTGLMIIYAAFSYCRFENGSQWRFIVPLAFVLLLFAFPMYVLADNLQPLDCAFGCDSFAANISQNNFSCNEAANSGLRLGFTTVTFIIVSALSFIFFCCRNSISDGEKVV